jgi:ABC-type branched-subunit amino acid transport system ATPase component
MTDTLEAACMTKSFAGVKAVESVGLRVMRGEIVGVIGPNGSGKTTLVNLITGVVRPDAGVVRCAGEEWQWLPAEKVARLGVGRTFQNIRLFRALSVFDNVATGAAVRSGRAWRARTRELLLRLGLEPYADRRAQTLSYGLQRRTEIARALAAQPKYLFLDEPAAGLNDTESAELGELLVEMRTEYGCGIVLIEHDVPLVLRVCDRIVALNEGRVIADGEPDAVRNDPEVKRAYLG